MTTTCPLSDTQNPLSRVTRTKSQRPSMFPDVFPPATRIRPAPGTAPGPRRDTVNTVPTAAGPASSAIGFAAPAVAASAACGLTQDDTGLPRPARPGPGAYAPRVESIRDDLKEIRKAPEQGELETAGEMTDSRPDPGTRRRDRGGR